MRRAFEHRPLGWRHIVLGALGYGLLVGAAAPPRYASRCGTDRLSVHEGRAIADSGAALAGATITVHRTDDPTGVAALFADAAGHTALANPFQADSLGRYRFYVAAGDYNIDVQSGWLTSVRVGVPVVDPRRPQVVQGRDTDAALALIEPASATASDDAALAFERVRADGSRVYGPWTLQANKGPASARAGLQWLYNADWNETTQATGPLVVADAAYRIWQNMIPPLVGAGQTQPFAFGFDVAPAGAAGTTPQWSTVWEHGQALVGGWMNGRSKVNRGPFVVGDGLPGSTLIARRIGWEIYNTTAPAGVLTPNGGTVDPTDSIQPGEVVVSVAGSDSYSRVQRTTQAAQRDAAVFLSGGNGTLPSTLMAGKALVRIEGGASVHPGDLLVSSGVEVGRAKVDNSVTEGRRILGFAIETANATLQGYVAMVRVNR